MTEAVARKKLVALCRHIISEWESGRDWRWPSAGREGKDRLQAIELDQKWPDYRSLAAAWFFIRRVSEGISEGLSGLDNLSWEETLMAMEETARCLESGKAIEDPSVLHYLPKKVGAGCNPFAALLLLFVRS